MILTTDGETTTYNKGSVYDLRNKLVAISEKIDAEASICKQMPTEELYYLADLVVGFNLKFDLAWLRKLGIDIFKIKKIHDCQLAEFILEDQKNPYPSLEETAIKYGLGHKLDIVKLHYWDKGINTDEIPWEVLSEYAEQDTDLTYLIYLKQLEQFDKYPNKFKLFKLACQDLLVLLEMEWNGLKLDSDLCKEKANQLKEELSLIYEDLQSIYPSISINFNSGDQLSSFLYGGSIYYTVKEHVGFFKNGKPKYKNVDKEHVLPRLIEPLKNSELAKEGKWKTDEGTLKKLKGPWAKKLVSKLLRVAELEKLNSTYYEGLLKKAQEMCWESGYIHGQFNQVVAGTGRLSSSNPNLQNMANECLDILVSRYDD